MSLFKAGTKLALFALVAALAAPVGTQAQHYRFILPQQNYVFKPGHRIMVQIQSTLFPLYDRNPQTFADNPLYPKPTDYRPATITVLRSADQASAVWLPVVPLATPGPTR